MHGNRCVRHLRIMDAIHQGGGGLYKLPPQRTALAPAVDDGRRPLPSLSQAAEDGQRSPIVHAEEGDRSVLQN